MSIVEKINDEISKGGIIKIAPFFNL